MSGTLGEHWPYSTSFFYLGVGHCSAKWGGWRYCASTQHVQSHRADSRWKVKSYFKIVISIWSFVEKLKTLAILQFTDFYWIIWIRVFFFVSIHGTSLCRFHLVGRWRGSDPGELRLYLCVTLSGGRGTFPLCLSHPPLRRALALSDENNTSVSAQVLVTN